MCDQQVFVFAVVILLVLFLVYRQKEMFSADEISAALIAKALISDPQDSTAIIRNMTPAQRKKVLEHMMPFDPNYYKH